MKETIWEMVADTFGRNEKLFDILWNCLSIGAITEMRGLSTKQKCSVLALILASMRIAYLEGKKRGSNDDHPY